MKDWIRTQKTLKITLFLVLSLGVWGFLEIADEVMDEETTQLDEAVLLALREPGDTADPIGPIWVEEGARDITALGSFALLFLFSVAAATFLLLSGKRKAALLFALSILSGTLLSSVLKESFDRTRPDLVAHQMHVLTASFPSGHSLLAALAYLSLGALLASTQPKMVMKIFVISAAGITAVLVGLSRLYLGVHWPTDVLAGWCAGAAWAMLWWLVALAVLPRREKEESGLEAESPPSPPTHYEGA